MDAYKLGQWTAVVLFGLVSFWFLAKALRTSAKYAKISNLSLFFGLLVLCRPEINISLDKNSSLFIIIEISRIIMGSLGFALGIYVIKCRFIDKTIPLVRPILGGVFSLLHIASGLCLLLLPGLISGGTVKSAWVYHSSRHNFSLTLPTEDWVKIKYPEGTVGFINRRYPMRVGVIADKVTEKQFRAYAKASWEEDAIHLQDRKHEEKTAENGCIFSFISGIEKQKDGSKDIYTAICYFWHPERGQMILVIFEGYPKMKSRFGKTSELKLFENSARSICFSIE